MSQRVRRRTVLTLAAVCLVAAFLVGTVWYFAVRPAFLLDRLLAGEDIEVTSVVFSGHEQDIVLDDPESVKYVTAALRAATYEGYFKSHGGVSYYVHVNFAYGGSFKAACLVPTDTDGLTIQPNSCTLVFDDPIHYWVPFPNPVPDRVKAVLQQLR